MKIKANLYKVKNEDPLGVNIEDKTRRFKEEIELKTAYFSDRKKF